MDGMSSETNEENDNTEKPVRRRHSSILKPPRSPLRDLRDGNEIIQEPNASRNKKSSRRVSFADTIKVFQTESHMKIVRKSEIAETEARENVLFIQNKNSEDNYCEITGMNTLLCAPIQTKMQQREISVIEHDHEKKHSHDQTVIFSDENQMDLTASHTVMITKGLLDSTKSEKSTKIDTTLFLANLKLHSEDSRMKKELNFSMDQNANSEKKINFSDFIKRLKTGKSNASSTGPDKENSEISIHSKESNRASSIHQMHASLNVDENSSNVTKIFREQDDGMNFTQCHTANIQSLVPTSSEANLREFKSDDITVYGNDLMDLTINRTIQILPSADNLSEIENQTQTVMIDVTTGCRTKTPGKKTVFENKPNAAFPDPSLNPKGEIHITRGHITGTETHTVTQTSNQDVRTLAMIPEPVCSSPEIQGYKTFLYSSCNDAMELTKCLSSMKEEKNLLEHDCNYAKMYHNSDANSLLIGKTIYSGEDSMDFTKSHTVAIDNQNFKEDQTNVQITAIPIFEKEVMFQNHLTVSKDEEMNVNCSSVPYVSKEGLQQDQANPLSISLTGKKTVIFTGEENDLTKSHTTNLGSQAPLASYNLASEDASKSHYDSKSLLNEWEKMTKSHNELSQQPKIKSKNILTDTWGKEINQVLKISPYLDKVSYQSVDVNQDKATSYNIVYSGGDLNKQVALGKNRNTVSCEQSLFPTTRLFSSEGQSAMENHNIAVNSHIVKSIPSQNSKLPESLRESLGNPTLDCSRDKTIICSEEEQNMDLTKSHTVVIGCGPSEVQELGKTNLEHTNSQLINRQVAVKVEKCNKTPIEKTGVFIFNGMDVLEDRSIQRPEFLNEKQDVKICGRKSIDGLKIDKTVIFSEGNENDMDITKGYTLEINHKPLLDEHDSHLVPLAGTSKTVLYTCGQDDMEVTRSHTTAIECETVSPDEIITRPVDKTVIFIDNHDELEMTKSHTVFIDYQAKERTVLPDRPDFELSKRKSLGKPKVTSAEKNVFFPENGENDHSAAKVSRLTVLGEQSNSGPKEKAVAFIADENMEVSASTIWKSDKDIQKPAFLNEPLSGKSQRRKSLRLKNGKPIAFSSNDKNDTIQSCTVEMNNKSALEDREDTCLMPLAGTSKTVLYTCGQDDMEVTRSHTTAIECETVSPDEIITRPVDKTVIFIDNHDELEMTKSHTVFIDYQAKERTVLPDRPDFELSKRKSLGKPKVTSAEKNVFFPENGENDHSAAKVSRLTVLGEQSNSGPKEKAVAFIADENMEVSASTIWKSDKDIQKPAFLNEPLSGKSQRRKSLRLKNGKPIAFSSNDKNDTIQSCTVEMNNKSALEDREDTCLMPLAGTSKTVLYTGGQDDMEITRSHTTALECKAVSPVKITTGPMDNTVMFIDNHSDQEVTKSHTAVTECQATEKILQECPKFGTAKRKTLGVSFPKDGSSVQEITKKQAQAVENKIVLHTEQKHHVIPYSNTLSGDQGEIGIIKFHNTAVDEKVMAKVVDQAYTLEKAKLESCHLNSTERRNVDFTNSHAPAICGSNNNYSCLPNAISSFDNLEGNVMSLCDKNEKASNCPVQNDLAYANDLASEYCLKSEGLLLTTPCFLLEKEKVTQTNTKGHLDDYVITVLKDQDLIKEPQSLLANQTLIHGQDLGNITKLDSKEVSFTLLPEDHMEDFVHNAEHSLKQTFVDDVFIGSQPHFSTHLPPLSQQGQSIVNKDEAILSKAGNKNLNTVIRNSSVPTYENESKMLNNEKKFTVTCEKELKKNIQTAKCNIAIDFHSNSELAKQVIQTHANPKEASDPVIASNASSFSSGKPNLNNLNGKTEELSDFLTAHIPPFPEQLLELVNKADSDMSVVQATEINNNTVSNSVKDDRDEENTFFHNRAETNSVPLMTVVNDKVRRCSLGIFLPRLPNKRNCSVTGIDDLEQIPSDTTDLNHLETQPVSSKDSGIGFIAAKLNLSPSQYINEEDLPIYPGEINSSESISIETEEKALIETYQKEISPSENKMKETCNSQKRTWVQEEDDDTQNEKKIRKSEIKFSDTAQDQQIFDHHAEGDIDKNANSVLMKSLGRTPSSCSSSLDSIKADGTSLDFSTYRNSQMESQLLTDTVCEESLKEKLKDGRITVKEFFILLQVHILIQKPRQSTLPAKFTINTQPTPEDLMLSQYVYRPKIQIYREDCEALRQKIEELKLSALNQDKLLTDVNRNLWEKMRHCSDEELKTFGIYLNKIKSHFTKMTKVFTHQGKVALYSKLVQSAQNEREKLQIRIDEMDNLLKKIANCLTELKIETKSLEDEKKDYHMEEWGSGMRTAEKELEQLKTEEEKLQRNLLELEVQKKQTLAQIDFVQKQTNTTEKLLDQLSLSEWDVIEWSDDQAVFTFLYDTIELTITFGEPVVGLPFLNKAYRRIVDLNFQSLLDEDKAPPSSILVHKLIFQYIEEQESWKKKCITQHQVSKMLQEISLVVSHCRLLGEEIEFLKRWGPNYNLMNIDVNNTELRLLFSSSAAFAKFEITLYLSAHYPSVLLPFSIKNHLGDISQDEISALLSKVPLEDNYLKNVVKQIYQDLLQGCDFYQ